ncbi:MAG: ThuA domain-containing protein [Planctomycetaceae bacterium]
MWKSALSTIPAVCAALAVIAIHSWPSMASADEKPHVVFVTGDCEYRSEVSMPMIARILEQRHNMRCTVLYAVNQETGKREPKFRGNIPGLEALKSADLAVFFVRFRSLPNEQFQLIQDYLESGKPVVGLRTSTHAFLYPEDNELKTWNDGFGLKVFGQKWITHHGHTSNTDVSIIPEKSTHPVLRGIDGEFHCASWLYHVAPLVGDCEPLLTGKSVHSEKSAEQQRAYPPTQPVAWTKTYKGARVFFTTLGHPQDFEQLSMRRLLINGILWSLGKDVPKGGANADVVGSYVAPPTT